MFFILLLIVQFFSLFIDLRWGPFTGPVCLVVGLVYKPPPACPVVSETANAAGVVYSQCQYEGPFQHGKPTCDTFSIDRVKPMSCVASDGRYAVFLAEVVGSSCPAHPPPCKPVTCTLEIFSLRYLVFVDLRSGEAVALPLLISEYRQWEAAEEIAEELSRYIVFSSDGVYLRGAPLGGRVQLGDLGVGTEWDVFTIPVKLDPAKLRIGQPVEAVNGTMVKVPLGR